MCCNCSQLSCMRQGWVRDDHHCEEKKATHILHYWHFRWSNHGSLIWFIAPSHQRKYHRMSRRNCSDTILLVLPKGRKERENRVNALILWFSTSQQNKAKRLAYMGARVTNRNRLSTQKKKKNKERVIIKATTSPLGGFKHPNHKLNVWFQNQMSHLGESFDVHFPNPHTDHTKRRRSRWTGTDWS